MKKKVNKTLFHMNHEKNQIILKMINLLVFY